VEGEELRFNVDDGFAAFDANKLTIAVERCTAEAEKALHESAEAEQQ
jgi:hypothetical protein